MFLFCSDDVQYQKTGGTWSNRVKVLINGEGRWLTAPIDRAYHGTRAINEIFVRQEDWRAKLFRTIEMAYGRAACFNDAMLVIEPLILNLLQNLGLPQTSMRLFLWQGQSGFDVSKFIRSSTIFTDSVATQRLIELTQSVGGQQYLCGGGAGGYQEDRESAAAGLELVYQGFIPRAYQQQGGKGISFQGYPLSMPR